MKSPSTIVASAIQQLPTLSSLNTGSLLIFAKWLLIGLLTLSLAHNMARLFWLLMPEPALATMTELTAQQGAESFSDTRESINIKALKELALFGESGTVAEQPVEVAPAPVTQAKETVLNVKLNGVFASSNLTQAYAIISQGKKQSLYRVGEALDNLRGVTLVSVLSDRVIIDNNGKNEAILLYPEGEQISEASNTHYEDTVKKEPTLSGAVSRLAADQKIQRLTDVIKISMARENGAVIGFRVRPGRNRQIFDKLGLMTNDIVTAVNGTDLSSPEVAMEMYRSMRNATQASVQIKRGDEQLSFDIDVATLEQ